jgi:hypothetical protein
MQVDAFGKIENCLDHHITQVNMEKDLSATVYDNYAKRQRFGENDSQAQSSYGGYRNYPQSNYSQSNYSQSNYGGNQRGQYRDNNYSSYGGDVASVNTFLSSQMGR